MKKLLPFIMLCFFFCCFSCNNQNKEKLLFVIVAKDALIKKQDNNTFTLTLKDTHKTATYFTDRPNRKAGKMLVSKFIESWKGFKEVPPNAAYVFCSTDDNPFSDVAVELTNPKYNSNEDTLTFTIKPLSKTKILKEGSFGETAVFIDDRNIPIEAGAIL